MYISVVESSSCIDIMKVLTQQPSVIPHVRNDVFWMSTSDAPRTHAIPAFSGWNERSTSKFDSTMADDVDKKVFRSTKNLHFSAPPTRKKLSHATTTTVSRAKAECNQVPHAVRVVASQETTPSNDFDILPQATIQVLEDIFDGIDEHVNVRKEVKDYDDSILSALSIEACCWRD
jgi:hypothetical protein